MSTKSSAATIMAWNWVIQFLAKFKQVDASILTGLVKRAPVISNDLGEDAREMVSLRILESLFINGNEATVDTDSFQNAKISFDQSEHCEDVLHKILEETSEPMTESERQKWNVRPFIIDKRASLPKSPLQKFKEALIMGRHPLLTSLKEKSKLRGANVSESTIPEVNVNFNPQTTVSKNDLVPVNPTNKNNKLQEIPKQNSEHIGRKEHEWPIVPPANGLEENPKNDILPNVSSSGPGPSVDRTDHMENDSKIQIDTDTEMSDDETTDNIAAKKEAFLNSQCTVSQESMATVDLTEITLCMKCNKGGEFLICNSDACQFRVHENCLGFSATFDENGKFFCPFCAYSHAISKYLEVKKKASLTRKDLLAFLSSGIKVNHTPMISSKIGDCLDKNKSETIGDSGKEDCAPAEPTADSLNQPTRQPGKLKRKYNEKESHVSSVSSHERRSRKRTPQYTSPTITIARRKKIQWTKSEEEKLKEGIRRFGCENKKGIPWKEILDFGRDVFDKGRTTIDLKDKWRNICNAKEAHQKKIKKL